MATMHIINTHDLARLARVSGKCGFEIDELLRDIGVKAADSADADAPWDIEALTQLYALGIARSSQAHFPFVVGEYFVFDRAPEVEAFIATSKSIRDALLMLDYLPMIIQPELVTGFSIEGERVVLSFDLERNGSRWEIPGLIETICIGTLRITEQILNKPVVADITFRHPPLTSLQAYQSQFGSLPAFNSPQNSISFPALYLDLPLKGSASLHAKAQILLETRINRLQASQGIVRNVEMLLRQSPGASMKELCLRLNIEPRTLQRKLKDAGTSFEVVQARIRHQRAAVMLLDPGLSIEVIALKLGFTDRNSFTKAFTRWTGTPPSQYRKEFSNRQ